MVNNIILYTSIVFWLIPPFRQFNGKYFYFFLILALNDPIALLFQTIKLPTNFITISSVILLAISIMSFKLSKQTWLLLFPSLILISYGIGLLSFYVQLWILLFGHFFILLYILRTATLNIFKTSTLNFFYFGIVFLEVTYITRLIAVLSDMNSGVIFYILTGFFQILIALFFSFFREDSKSIQINLS